jgi:hypothetical protein
LISGPSMISTLCCSKEFAPLQFELRSAANQDCICAFAICLPAREALLGGRKSLIMKPHRRVAPKEPQ